MPLGVLHYEEDLDLAFRTMCLAVRAFLPKQHSLQNWGAVYQTVLVQEEIVDGKGS